MQSEPRAATGKLVLAFFLIYFIWGSTYLAIRYAIETIPPFLMAGARFLTAGLLMYGFMRLRGASNPTLRQWWQLAIVGMFLFLGGNGLVVWAEQYITSGLAALLVSLLPLWLILIDWLWVGGSAPKPIAMIGILFGIVGTVVLIDPVQFTDSDIHLPGALTVLLASLLWAIGSIYSKKFRQPDSIFMSAAVQMIGGGISLLLVSAGLGELQGFEPGRISRTSVAGFSYLMVFGSMIAISAYVWLLQNATATSVSTYAFVNPAVAVFLGWLIADEAVNAHILFGAGIILAGVFLVVFASIRKNTVRTIPGPSSIED